MIHFNYKEGDKIKYGFNFWSFKNPSSLGFILRYTKRRILYVRWSKLSKKWFIHWIISKDIPEDWRNVG